MADADPKSFLFIVNDAPRRVLARELAVWFHDLGVWDRVIFHAAADRDIACQYNQALALALATGHDQFVFADSDIRPHTSRTGEFWTADADVVGVRYPTESDAAWEGPPGIHCGLWRTRRAVLEALPRPHFQWEYNPNHTHLTGCICRPFSRRVREAGFTLAHAGWAMHEVRKTP